MTETGLTVDDLRMAANLIGSMDSTGRPDQDAYRRALVARLNEAGRWTGTPVGEAPTGNVTLQELAKAAEQKSEQYHKDGLPVAAEIDRLIDAALAAPGGPAPVHIRENWQCIRERGHDGPHLFYIEAAAAAGDWSSGFDPSKRCDLRSIELASVPPGGPADAAPAAEPTGIVLGDLPSVNFRKGKAYSYCPECGTEYHGGTICDPG